ncbi:MAG: hypothetical protein ABR903_01590, partial [Thermodesulfovibrionales bacterium]
PYPFFHLFLPAWEAAKQPGGCDAENNVRHRLTPSFSNPTKTNIPKRKEGVVLPINRGGNRQHRERLVVLNFSL